MLWKGSDLGTRNPLSQPCTCTRFACLSTPRDNHSAGLSYATPREHTL